MVDLRQQQQMIEATKTQNYLQLPKISFESIVKELSDFIGAEKALEVLSEVRKGCVSTQKGVSVQVSSLLEVQKELQKKTGFGASVMMHSAGRAAAGAWNPKSIAECRTILEAVGFDVKDLDLSESQVLVEADAQGLDYFFLGLTEGLSSQVFKKEVNGKIDRSGSFRVIIP